MDKLQWFKFTPSDWMMGKIQRCPEITQARFLRLCCLYWNKDCEISIEDAEIEIDKEHYDILVSRKIISVSETNINISFLDEQKLEIKEVSKDKSTSGIVGNLKRWHFAIYQRFIAKEISLEKAIELSKIIAPQSHPDSTPIAPQSQSIADKIKIKTIQDKEEIREDNINNSLLSEIKISDDKNFFIINNQEIETDQNALEYFTIAEKFRNLFIKNLKEKGSPFVHQEKATFKNYVSPIRLMIENKEATIAQLREAYSFLNSVDGEFWKSNILSTTALRKQISTLIAKKNMVKQPLKPKIEVPDHRKRNKI